MTKRIDSERPTGRTKRYSRWRAACLAAVYLLMGVHIAHWKIAGRTLAPLELNEVMHTLELGIVTAGFLFMAVTLLATVVFGRFFCSWGCHVLALQDLCAWILGKLRIRPAPIRSRVLLFVPLLAMLYMFVWPQIARLGVTLWPDTVGFFGHRPDFDLRIAGESEAWASFVTTDFWRNLPGPWITGLTFLVCGFVIVYLLGSRSFCHYACPYGVVFGLADRVAPGRVLLRGDCTECGLCTAGCQSGIRVHEEVLRFGKVVSSRCLKDLDCVAVCPTEGLEFGFTKPTPLTSLLSKKRPRPRYDFSPVEELLLAVTFLGVLVVFRGLYSAVPFLMALGLAAVLSFLTVWTGRLFTRRAVWLGGEALKISGRVTSRGRAYVAIVALLATFTVHSGFVRYHEASAAGAIESLGREGVRSGATEKALAHLSWIEEWGLFESPSLKPQLAMLHLAGEHFDEAERTLREILASDPDDAEARFHLARTLLGQKREREARMQLAIVAHSDASAHVRADAHQLLAAERASFGDRRGTIVELRAVVAADSLRIGTRLDLADLLALEGELDEAEAHLRFAIRERPGSVRALHNLAVLRAKRGDRDEAIELLGEAARIAPGEVQIREALEALSAQADDLGFTR